MRCRIVDVLDNWTPGATAWRGTAVVGCAAVRVRFRFEYAAGRQASRDFEYAGRSGGKLRRPLSVNDRDIYIHHATKALDEWAQRARRA